MYVNEQLVEQIAKVIANYIRKDYGSRIPSADSIRDYVDESGIKENISEYIAIIRRELSDKEIKRIGTANFEATTSIANNLVAKGHKIISNDNKVIVVENNTDIIIIKEI